MASTLEDFERRLIRIEQAIERLAVPQHTSGVSVGGCAPTHHGPFTFWDNLFGYFERDRHHPPK